ncbi:class I SAM-dependent methyltransferase [Candidatus Poriferisodalis sp.]|uniref:class I SAM-dependent methyltransferase n=1 Tax=Candidatus Poriferisodalis sp. TaxID=3101277 RepID=UPI003B522481
MADRYVAETINYERFPGLREDILRFEASVPEARPILDLGGGSGRDALFLAQLGRRVIFGDLVAEFCVIAKGAGLPAVHLDAVALPFGDGTFGGVLCSGVLLHVPRTCLGAALSEIARVLTEDGMAWISMKEGHGTEWKLDGYIAGERLVNYYTVPGISDTCEDVGLAVVGEWHGTARPWFSLAARRVTGT